VLLFLSLLTLKAFVAFVVKKVRVFNLQSSHFKETLHCIILRKIPFRMTGIVLKNNRESIVLNKKI